VRLALSATGGVTSGTAAARVLLSTLLDGQTLEQAIAAPRVHHSGSPDVAFTETGERTFDPAPLVKRGHEIKPVALPSRINALQCGSGLANFGNCRVVTDPRGFGLAQVIGKD
jgi:gamma-glutamyltranspeptidase/glutathione hydrolase